MERRYKAKFLYLNGKGEDVMVMAMQTAEVERHWYQSWENFFFPHRKGSRHNEENNLDNELGHLGCYYIYFSKMRQSHSSWRDKSYIDQD